MGRPCIYDMQGVKFESYGLVGGVKGHPTSGSWFVEFDVTLFPLHPYWILESRFFLIMEPKL